MPRTRTNQIQVAPRKKVPLHEASQQLQLIDDLLNQIEQLAESPTDDPEGLGRAELESLLDQRRSDLARELNQLRQAQQSLFEQAINRMLNRAAFETRQLVGEEAMGKYLQGQARSLSGEARRRRQRVKSIKASIAAALQIQDQTRLETDQHRMYLSRSTRVVIDETLVPPLEEALELNQAYPGIITQLKFSESGRLIDVEFRSSVIAQLLKRGDAEVERELAFARLQQQQFLVVPTISESGMAKQVVVEEGDYGPELDWV